MFPLSSQLAAPIVRLAFQGSLFLRERACASDKAPLNRHLLLSRVLQLWVHDRSVLIGVRRGANFSVGRQLVSRKQLRDLAGSPQHLSEPLEPAKTALLQRSSNLLLAYGEEARRAESSKL
jgi:hypothetical protein